MVRRLFRNVLIFGILVCATGAIAFAALCRQINRTGERDEAQPADAIVILGARVEADGNPGPDLYSRTLHAVDLFQRGLASYLICSGGYRGDRLSAASVAARLAARAGVPAERILLADGSMTTREDAARVRELMAEQGWSTAIVVSHPLHLERVRLLFEGEGLRVYTSPTTTDLGAMPWSLRAWLTAREAGGIIWAGLEKLGIPYGWTEPLSRYVYGARATPAGGSN
jgi:uncharacterized SAM-binding protein YcdF (DUF218 family)